MVSHVPGMVMIPASCGNVHASAECGVERLTHDDHRVGHRIAIAFVIAVERKAGHHDAARSAIVMASAPRP